MIHVFVNFQISKVCIMVGKLKLGHLCFSDKGYLCLNYYYCFEGFLEQAMIFIYQNTKAYSFYYWVMYANVCSLKWTSRNCCRNPPG